MIQSIVLPTIIILLPIALFSIFRLSIKSKIRSKVLVFGVLLLLIGLMIPWVATFVSANGLAAGMPDDQPKCVIGAAVFLYYGYLINLIGIPLLGIVFYVTGKK